jgi:hypothetical protein
MVLDLILTASLAMAHQTVLAERPRGEERSVRGRTVNVDVTFLAANSGIDAVVRHLMAGDRMTLQAQRIARTAQEPRMRRSVWCVTDRAAFTLERHLVRRHVLEAIQGIVLGVAHRALSVAALWRASTCGLDALHVTGGAIEPAILDRMMRNMPHVGGNIVVALAAQRRWIVAQQRTPVAGVVHRMTLGAAQTGACMLMLQPVGLER